MNWFFFVEKSTAIILLTVLSVYDIRTKRIPNRIVFTGMGIAFILFVINSIFRFDDGLHWIRLCLFVSIFFFGMTNLIGLGDIKLLMALSLITHPVSLCFAVALACLFMVVYAIIRNPRKTILKIQFSMLNVYRNSIPSVTRENEETIPFVPFLLAGYIVTTIVEVFVKCR